MTTSHERFLQYAQQIKALGFTVFVCTDTSYNYGFYSHASSLDKVVYFEYHMFDGLKFSHKCYASRSHGTGCAIDFKGELSFECLYNLLTSPMPAWYKRPERDRLSLKQCINSHVKELV
jgi:hypothetical protein